MEMDRFWIVVRAETPGWVRAPPEGATEARSDAETAKPPTDTTEGPSEAVRGSVAGAEGT